MVALSTKAKKEEKGKPEITAETVLAPQLGTDPIIIVQGQYDDAINTNINEIEAAWLTHFSLIDPIDGGGYALQFCQRYKAHKRSISGWGVNKMIQMVAGAKGTSAVGSLKKKPGIFQRNLTDRDWKRKADEQGETIVE